MKNISVIIDKYPDFVSYFWYYQYKLGKEYIVPYFQKSRIDLQNKNVLEIGSGEGGVLGAIAEQRTNSAVGFDIREGVVGYANNIAFDLQNPCKFFVHNIYNEQVPEEWKNNFDIILMRDVIEHLDNTEGSLLQLLKFAKQDAFIFITFPPYYSAYGAHQHTLKNIYGKIPFIQLLPNPVFNRLIKSGREADKMEVSRLRKIRLTIKKFRNAAKKTGLHIEDEKLFLSRPVFKIKFGLPVISLSVFKHLDLIHELFITEASYLLRIKEETI
jgi:SAM-dependent methyltransferase